MKPKFILSEDEFHSDVIKICNTPVNTNEFVDTIKGATEENLRIALGLLINSPVRTKKKQDLIKNELRIIREGKCINHQCDDLLEEWDEVCAMFKKR